MRAAVVGENGAEVRELPKPEPAPGEVLIRVRASSLNRADVGVAAGQQHGRVGGIGARLGLECAGEVEAVVSAGRLKRGETVLIQGASSGVGLMGMQIAKLMGASLVMGGSTNAGRRARLKDYGCDLPIDTSDPKWPEEVKKATGGKGADLVVDMVSAPVANQNLDAAAILGRIVNVGRLGGQKGEFNYDLHALKRIDYIGVTFRTRSM